MAFKCITSETLSQLDIQITCWTSHPKPAGMYGSYNATDMLIWSEISDEKKNFRETLSNPKHQRPSYPIFSLPVEHPLLLEKSGKDDRHNSGYAGCCSKSFKKKTESLGLKKHGLKMTWLSNNSVIALWIFVIQWHIMESHTQTCTFWIWTDRDIFPLALAITTHLPTLACKDDSITTFQKRLTFWSLLPTESSVVSKNPIIRKPPPYKLDEHHHNELWATTPRHSPHLPIKCFVDSCNTPLFETQHRPVSLILMTCKLKTR